MDVLQEPCAKCKEGNHDDCNSVLCGCIAPHKDDEDIVLGFKKIKRMMHPERESWTKGGW